MVMTFARPRLLRLGNNSLTDHNRSELGVDIERIETRQRMANGTMRKYWVADKRTFSVSWTDVPNKAIQTVDGYWSGTEINNFFNSGDGRDAFTLRITDNKGVDTTATVVITDFSYTVKKRWATWELWDFSLTMEEV